MVDGQTVGAPNPIGIRDDEVTTLPSTTRRAATASQFFLILPVVATL